MKVPVRGLLLPFDLDVVVKPLRRLIQRGNSVRFALPHSYHGNYQKDEGREFEKYASE
jgi:hypothetical protein